MAHSNNIMTQNPLLYRRQSAPRAIL